MGINGSKDSGQYLVHRLTAVAIEAELTRAELVYGRAYQLIEQNRATIARLQDRLASY